MGQPNDVPRDTASRGTETDGDLSDDESRASLPAEPEQSLEEVESADEITRERLAEEMRSSHWILEELRRLTAEFASESGQSSDSVSGDERAGSNSTDSESGSVDERLHEILATVQTLEKARSTESARQSNESDQSLPIDGSIVAFVSDLQRQLGALGGDMDDLTERQETRFERVSTDVDHLTDRVDWMEFIHEQFAETDDLVAVSDELTAANERIEELRSTTDELESQIGREFDSIEALFRRVLDAVEDLDSELETAVSSFREELEPLWARHAEREQLKLLKTEAMQRKIRRGNCDQCDQSVDLSLLEFPICPGCSSSFIGIDSGGWNPFRSPKLKTD